MATRNFLRHLCPDYLDNRMNDYLLDLIGLGLGFVSGCYLTFEIVDGKPLVKQLVWCILFGALGALMWPVAISVAVLMLLLRVLFWLLL